MNMHTIILFPVYAVYSKGRVSNGDEVVNSILARGGDTRSGRGKERR